MTARLRRSPGLSGNTASASPSWWTPTQIKAYRIADNKVAELASWDMDLLPIELSELRDMDVDLELLGFSTEELEKMLGASDAEGLTDPDAVPEPPNEPVTRRVLHLGRLCQLSEDHTW